MNILKQKLSIILDDIKPYYDICYNYCAIQAKSINTITLYDILKPRFSIVSISYTNYTNYSVNVVLTNKMLKEIICIRTDNVKNIDNQKYGKFELICDGNSIPFCSDMAFQYGLIHYWVVLNMEYIHSVIMQFQEKRIITRTLYNILLDKDIINSFDNIVPIKRFDKQMNLITETMISKDKLLDIQCKGPYISTFQKNLDKINDYYCVNMAKEYICYENIDDNINTWVLSDIDKLNDYLEKEH